MFGHSIADHHPPSFNYDPPLHTVNVAHTITDRILPGLNIKELLSSFLTLTRADYAEYLQYQTAKQYSYTIAPTSSSNSFACIIPSSRMGQWILDSGAFDHISGNRILLSSLVSPSLSTVDLANGSKAAVKR